MRWEISEQYHCPLKAMHCWWESNLDFIYLSENLYPRTNVARGKTFIGLVSGVIKTRCQVRMVCLWQRDYHWKINNWTQIIYKSINIVKDFLRITEVGYFRSLFHSPSWRYCPLRAFTSFFASSFFTAVSMRRRSFQLRSFQRIFAT